MDRTIPPGAPEGEDAGAVVGVGAPDSTDRSSPTASNKANPDKARTRASRAKAALAGRIAVAVPGRPDPEGRIGISSAAPEP